MLARRLLIAGSGGAIPTVPPTVRSLGEIGLWSDLSHPRATYYNGKTYLIWITDTGAVKAGAYDHATHTMSSATTLHSGFTAPDGVIHLAASIIVRASDHKLVVTYGNQGARPYIRVSTNAEDTSAWSAEANFLASLSRYTYSFLNQLDNGDLVYITRYLDTGPSIYKWTYAVSTDGGATWGGQATFLIPSATTATYLYAVSHGNRVHIFTTDTDRTAGNPSSVYHLYLEGTTLYQSDGTSIAGPYPVASTAGTLVQGASGGAARCNGIAFDGSGNPAGILLINDGNMSTTNTAKVARWTGSAWQVDTVAGQGGHVDSNNFVASANIAKDDPDTVYLPVKVGSYFELRRYVSPDNGATWTPTDLTTSSGADNAMPETPLGAAAGLRAVWGLGTYTNENNFDFTLHGWG